MRSKCHQFARLCVSKMNWKVFPLRPRDKRPLTVHGFKDATDDIRQVDLWWSSNPRAGIGLPTGKVNGLVVIDLDPRNAPETVESATGETLTRDAWDLAHDVFGPELPETWVVETPGGGLHFYFLHPGDHVIPGVKGWQDGVDVKSDGGYVCAPPSIHPSGGEYEWSVKPDGDTPLAPLPEFIVSAMADHQRQRVEKEIKGNLGDGKLAKGHRNDALTSLAGTMQRRGMDPEAILAALLAENRVKCQPPLPEDEVVTIVTSISRYEPDPEATPKSTPSKVKDLQLDAVSELVAQPPPVEWLIPGRLARGDCALLVGAPGSGKSWIALDLALSSALGKPVLERWPVEKPLRVMYVDEENPRDELNRRLHVIFNATVQNGARPGAAQELGARLFMFRSCQGFTFRERDGYVESLTRHVSQIEPDLIVFDSITAVSGIQDENKATEIRGFFHDKLYPLRRICNSAILCIHHSNKKAYETEGHQTSERDGQIRGSIDYLAAVDACLFASVVKDKTTGRVTKRVLHQIKQRRDAEPPAVLWGLEGRRGPDGLDSVRPRVIDSEDAVARVDTQSVKGFMAKPMPGNYEMFKNWSKAALVKWALAEMSVIDPTGVQVCDFIDQRAGRKDVTPNDVSRWRKDGENE